MLDSGSPAIIRDIGGGFGLRMRLENLGLRVGKTIRRRSAMPMRGPIVVEVDGRDVALGFGMAMKIMVEPLVGFQNPRG
ncbi:MAG: FeoA family protein [bacterium]